MHREGLSPHLLAPPRSERLTNGGLTQIREARFQFDARTGRLVDSGVGGRGMGTTATSKKDLKVGDQKEIAELVSHVKRSSAKLSQMLNLGELVGKFIDEGLPENRGIVRRALVTCFKVERTHRPNSTGKLALALRKAELGYIADELLGSEELNIEPCSPAQTSPRKSIKRGTHI